MIPRYTLGFLSEKQEMKKGLNKKRRVEGSNPYFFAKKNKSTTKTILSFVLVFIFSIFSTCVLCQNKKVVDSLKNTLRTAKDTNRVNILYNLSDKYHQDDPKQGMKYADEAIELSKQLHFSNGLFHGNMSKGLVLYDIGKFDSALYYFEIAKTIAQQNNNNEQLAAINSNMGNVYGDKGQDKKCIQLYLIAVEYTHKINNPSKEAYMLVNIGTVYSVLGQHDSAVVYYFQAEKILSSIDRNQEKLPIVYNNIGASYMELHDTAKAKIAFENALRISLLLNNKRGLASAYDHLGIISYSDGKKDSAVSLLKNSISIYESVDAKSGISEASSHLGDVYFEMKEYDKAILVLNKGMKIAEELTDYYNLKSYYETLSKVYEAQGELDQALIYERKFAVLKDTIFNLSNTSVVNEMKTEAAYQNDQHKLELADARDQKKTTILYWSTAMAFIILLLGIVAFNRYLVKKRSNKLLEKQNDEINIQKNIIEEKNKDITDSITYARRIQQAKLPSKVEISASLSNYFILFKPKAIVSGDFYFFQKNEQSVFIAAVDCTGHGVPGAFMSIIASEKLEDAISQSADTSEILRQLNVGIKTALRQSDSDESTRDGLDIALCSLDMKNGIVKYAGANRPLWIIRQGQTGVEEIKATKKAIGGLTENNQQFESHELELQNGDTFYICTDGFADQFSGKNGKKLMTKKFKEILVDLQQKTMSEQEIFLDNFIEKWKEGAEQVDDILVIGVQM